MTEFVSPEKYTDCIRVLRCQCRHGWVRRYERAVQVGGGGYQPRQTLQGGHKKKRAAVKAAKRDARQKGVRVIIHRADGQVDRHHTDPEED